MVQLLIVLFSSYLVSVLVIGFPLAILSLKVWRNQIQKKATNSFLAWMLFPCTSYIGWETAMRNPYGWQQVNENEFENPDRNYFTVTALLWLVKIVFNLMLGLLVACHACHILVRKLLNSRHQRQVAH